MYCFFLSAQFKNTILGKVRLFCFIIFSVNFLFLPFRWFCQSDGFLPDPHLLPFSGYIMLLTMSLCRHEADTHPSGVRLQRH